MASKNINVEISVYEKLVNQKRGEESFSQLFERMISKQKRLNSIYGAGKKTTLNYKEIKKARGKDRNVDF